MGVILSDEERTLFETVNFVLISSPIGVFGVATNVINVIIFHKQGLTKYANIGFFGLAVSDIICLITLLWSSILLNPLIGSSMIPWDHFQVMYLSGGLPHICFTRITSFMTVYITAERYFSIAFPLKVKNIITPKTSTLILCLIYVVNLSTLFPEYATTYLDWKFVTTRNKTLIGIHFTQSRKAVEGIVFILHSVLGMTSFASVTILTSLLVIELRQSSQWRTHLTSSNTKNEYTANKDKKAVKMVVLIASVLIACYIPGATISFALFILGPEFNAGGKYINFSRSLWSIAITFQCINSSINIFIYYTMSSKYRQTFNEIFFSGVKTLKGSSDLPPPP